MDERTVFTIDVGSAVGKSGLLCGEEVVRREGEFGEREMVAVFGCRRMTIAVGDDGNAKVVVKGDFRG